ncbi:MAG: ribonuclease R, partial [Acidobacteriales bacterium]|nr:ribonuclease R [Terriglobales bacterium]
LTDDRYFFRDTDRQIVGARNGRVFRMGERVHVLLDRIDRQQKRLQFALLDAEGDTQKPGAPRPASGTWAGSAPKSKGKAKSKTKPKAKVRARDKKSKGKRKKS